MIFVFATVLSHLKMKAAAVVNKSAIFCLFVSCFFLDESINDEISLGCKYYHAPVIALGTKETSQELLSPPLKLFKLALKPLYFNL